MINGEKKEKYKEMWQIEAGFPVKQLLPRGFTCILNSKIQAHKLSKTDSKSFLFVAE